MVNEIKVSVSILCADFAKLGEEIKKCEDAGVDIIHVDVMDGHFVPNITIGPLIVQAIRPLTKLPIDAHLMIEEPWRYIDDFIAAGVDSLSIHAECYGLGGAPIPFPQEVDKIDTDRAREDIRRIRERNVKVFMVLNPESTQCLGPLLDDLDGVLVMSVVPGFAKQKFMPKVLPKLQQLRDIFDKDIAIDGGINEFTAPEAVKAGANIIATASYFFSADKPKDVVKFLKALKIQ